MTSKKSFFELVRDGVRRNLWALVLSGLGFFFTLLLPSLMCMQNYLEQFEMAKSAGEAEYTRLWAASLDDMKAMVGPVNPMVKLAFIVIAAVLGVAMFAYLHSRQKVDFYHSLPVSRTRLFYSNFVTGIVCAVPMYFIMLAITLVCVNAMGFSEALSASLILGAVLDHMVCFLIIYALTVLTTVVCGNTIITLLLWLWVMFSPMLIKGIQIGLYSLFYTTFQETAQDEVWLYRLSPIVHYFLFDGTGMDNSSKPGAGIPLLITYAVIAVLATLLACWLFRIRKSERAGMALAFEPMKLPVKVYMCAVIGVVAALMLQAVGGAFWFWPGLVLGVVLFHMVVEIIYAFDFKAILSKPIEMGIILAAVAAVVFALKMDITGFDKWIPSENSIESVDIDDSGYISNSVQAVITDPEMINAVRRIAELGVEEDQKRANIPQVYSMEVSETVPSEASEVPEYQHIAIRYMLSGGRLKARAYDIPYTDELKELFVKITGNAEFKRAKWDVFEYEKEMNERESEGFSTYNKFTEPHLVAHTEASLEDPAELFGTDKDAITKILQTYEQEALTRTGNGNTVIRLEFGWHSKNNKRDAVTSGYAYVTDKDVKTLALLKQLMDVEPEPIPMDEIKRAEIDYYWPERGENINVEVTDKADVQKIYENSFSGSVADNSDDFWTAMKCGCSYTESGSGCNVYLIFERDGKEIYVEVSWAEGKVPKDVIKKYRPAEIYETENFSAGPAAIAEDGPVTTITNR